MTTQELELTLTRQQKIVLDYIVMEFLTVDESNSLTPDKLHKLMLLIKEEFIPVNWSYQMDSNYKYTCKKFCKILYHYILDIVN
jgi:hypothetical protein